MKSGLATQQNFSIKIIDIVIMCGFLSIIDKKNNIDESKFRGLNNLLKHRGPDSGDVFVDNNVALGARRLRIHDLSSKGDQPFTSTCGRYKISFNGAVYNYRQLRKKLKMKGCNFRTDTDTEVLLEGFITEGPDFVKQIDGMFAYSIYDTIEKKIFLFRDHVGIKPLYYYSNDSLFIASSEVKPILEYPKVTKKVNVNAIPEFFAFQAILPPDTLFQDINVFPPGHFLELSINGPLNLSFIPFWEIEINKIDDYPDEKLESDLILNLDRCWNNDRKTAIQLSGGVDSSLISYWSKNNLNIKNIDTYSVIFNDDERVYYKPRSEEKYINQVSGQLKLNSKKYIFNPNEIRSAFPLSIWYHEAPLTGPSTLLYYLLAKKIKNQVTVVITGEGADDLFNGYYDNWSYDENIESLFKFFVPKDYLKELFSFNEENNFLTKISNYKLDENFNRMSPIQKTSYLTIKKNLHSLLARHDRMFMANGIEGRPPFTSKNIIDGRFSMPDDKIHNNSYGKFIIKKIAEKYFSKNFAFRDKIGFSSPYGDWLSQERYLGNYWKYLNFDMIDEYMNIDFVKNILSLPDSKEKWTGHNLNFLMCLLNFQIWHSLFFEGKKDELIN